jgi:transposase InsO family protein
VQRLCAEQDVTLEMTAPNTPQMNGVVERSFATCKDRAFATMYCARFSLETQALLWPKAINTVTKIMNTLPRTASCGKFAEIPTDLYKNMFIAVWNIFCVTTPTVFIAPFRLATFENQFWTGFYLIRFSSTIFNIFQPIDIFRSHVSSITERSKDTKHFTVMFVGNTELSNLSS